VVRKAILGFGDVISRPNLDVLQFPFVQSLEQVSLLQLKMFNWIWNWTELCIITPDRTIEADYTARFTKVAF
jgi:hypothetical protein